jgi:tyrosine-protein kinase Etk/Wzc
MKPKHNLLEVLKTLFKWKKQIFYVCAAAVIGTAVISLFLPNYYQAATVFLAVSPDQAKPEALYGKGQLRTEYYGNENDIDRILTIASSTELANFMVDSFELYNHYKIKPGSPKAAFKVRQKFSSLYDVTKTKRDAIELSVEDKDKELAARMATVAREKIEAVAQQLIREGLEKTIRSYQDNIKAKEASLAILSDSLSYLRREYGIYNIVGQTEALPSQVSETEGNLIRNQAKLEALKNTPGISKDTIKMLQANVAGLQEEFKVLSSKMESLNEGLGKFGIYERQFIEANQALSEDKERLKQTLALYTSDIPAIVIVEEAQVPVIKSRPKRSIIVLAAGAIAFFFSVLAVLLFDTYQDVDWREVYHAK